MLPSRTWAKQLNWSTLNFGRSTNKSTGSIRSNWKTNTLFLLIRIHLTWCCKTQFLTSWNSLVLSLWFSHSHSFQGVYSDAEIQLFRTLLIEIAKQAEHYTTYISALNMTASIKVTKVHSQELIDKWIDEGLFAEVDDRLYLGPRGIAEFGPYLRVHYPHEVCACKLCKEPIFTVRFWKLDAVIKAIFY